MPSITITSEFNEFWRLRIVNTPELVKRGLMFQKHMRPYHGMFFVFDESARRSMWMKNMMFPLDIVWLNQDLEIVHINRHAVPCESEPCKSYSSVYKVRYAIEMNSGEAQNLTPGIRLKVHA